MLAPVACAAIFLGVGYWALSRQNPDELPSALTQRAAPGLALEPLIEGAPVPETADLSAPGVKLVNFWASWCAPCRAEHPMLMAIARSGVPIYGVNYKDKPGDAQGFLADLGDPFTRIGADPTGRNGINWGLYGVPETFVIDGSGKVLLRHPGPITKSIYDSRIRPLLEGK
ncbi:DsbE family thiol:disulfide interchange protein [Paroceanicella profunda]|uniref:DsbE family thiol:disulfide interchange protein n=1 Tax=Paroceanicella profunda TaxID=2579971 RepID=A0A5B8G4B1_9RHOB|nr:DsbE family thiol:disulfide interchange protein [Paroceanicella profunda]QDL93733.1 DsbE family thiol:disulfide interchange protein [Paroceanicella profunda]